MGKAIEINGRDQFCGACHAFSAVNLSCFGCHASVPKGGPVSDEALAGHRGAAVAGDRNGPVPGVQLADDSVTDTGGGR